MEKFTSEEFKQTLQTYAEEPLHQISGIQPQSATLVLRADNRRTLLQASDNLADFIDFPEGCALGKPLSSLVGEAASLEIEQLILAAQAESTAVGTLSIRHGQKNLDLLVDVYLSDGMFVLELERDDGVNQLVRLSELLLNMQRTVLSSASETESVYFEQMTDLVRELTGFDSVMVCRFDENGDGNVINQSRVKAAPSYLGSQFSASDIPPEARTFFTKNLVRVIADLDENRVSVQPELNLITQQPIDMTYSVVGDPSPIEMQFMRNMGFQASMVISLLHNKRLWGLILCHHMTPKRVSIAMREAAVFISDLASATLSSGAMDLALGRVKQQQQQPDQLENIDTLTGLANERSFFEEATLELLRAQRYRRPLSILVMDIDYFRNVNHNYGHKAGDLALKKLASVCKEVLREVDIIGRVGGEEFAVLLPETDGAKAMEVAERMRQHLEHTRVKLDAYDKPLQFTASFGVATITETEYSIDSLLQDADVALFKAKGAGRNRVVTSF